MTTRLEFFSYHRNELGYSDERITNQWYLYTCGKGYGLDKQGTDMDGLYNPVYDRSNTGYFSA